MIRFVSHSGLELPHPEILTVHAALANILYASGKGEKIEKAHEARDSMKYLAPDGSSDMLTLYVTHALAAY